MKLQRVLESAKITFSILGCAGFAGELAMMHTFLALVSAGIMGVLWYAVYLHVEVIQ